MKHGVSSYLCTVFNFQISWSKGDRCQNMSSSKISIKCILKVDVHSILQDTDCCSKVFTYLNMEDIIRFGWLISKLCKKNISGECWRTTVCKYKWRNADGYKIMERFEAEFENKVKELSCHQQMYRELYHHVVKLERSTLIFDLGSETVKCGYSCESYPFICEPTYKFLNTDECKKEFNTSASAVVYAEVIQNILKYLNVDMQIAKIFFIIRPFDLGYVNVFVEPQHIIRKIGTACFEILDIQEICFEYESVCALNFYGKQHGIVLSCGNNLSYVCNVHNGLILKPRLPKTMVSKVGGKHLTMLMENMINNNNQTMIEGNYKCSANDARVLKEQYTYTRAAVSKWCPSATDTDGFLLESENYTLENDTATIKLRTERFLIPEALFEPSLFSKYHVLEKDKYEREILSVQELCRRTTNAIDSDDRKLDIYRSLVCIGGGLDFPSFELRLHRELRRMKLRIFKIYSGSGKRIYTSWRGACSFCYTRDSLKANAEISRSVLENKNTTYKRKHGFGRWVDKEAWSKFGSSAFYKDINNNFYNKKKGGSRGKK